MTSPRAVLATVVVVGALGLGLAFLSSTGRLPPPLAVGVAVAPALAGAVAGEVDVDARMAQRPAPAVAGDGRGVRLDGLGRRRCGFGRRGHAVLSIG